MRKAVDSYKITNPESGFSKRNEAGMSPLNLDI
jgi:hypothetical protein